MISASDQTPPGAPPPRPAAARDPRSPVRLALFLLFAVLFYAHFRPADRLRTHRGHTMGTYYQVKYFGDPRRDVAAEIEAILREVNRQMSTYLEDSEISRFNRGEADVWHAVSPDFQAVAALAARVHRESRGRFEPTLGPLVALWGFGPDYRAIRVPDEAEIAAARRSVGYEKVELRADPPALRKPLRDLAIDFSGIAKGYGVDLVARHLEAIGIPSYLVEIGGEIRTGAAREDGREWAVAVEKPDAGHGDFLRVIYPKGYAVATSGDYRNYFEQDGRRYSHLIDPTTGRPIENRVASVSVAARSCAEADAWATAMMVLGYEDGAALGEELGLPLLWILREDGRFIERSNAAFARFVTPEEPARLSGNGERHD